MRSIHPFRNLIALEELALAFSRHISCSLTLDIAIQYVMISNQVHVEVRCYILYGVLQWTPRDAPRERIVLAKLVKLPEHGIQVINNQASLGIDL